MGLNKMEHDYTTQFTYYRVPSNLTIPGKGKPHPAFLIRYVRSEGFLENDFPPDRDFTNISPHSRGGKVYCNIEDKTGCAASGIANCSYSDNFCYKIGREIALDRAKKQLKEKETK